MSLILNDKKVISSQVYYQQFFSSSDCVSSVVKRFKRTVLVGKHTMIYFLQEPIAFEVSLLCKIIEGLHLIILYVCEFYTVSEICVGKRVRGLGSSVTTRFVHAKYMLERKTLLFSPRVVYIGAFTQGDMSQTIIARKIKSKLYFLKADYHKYLLSALL